MDFQLSDDQRALRSGMRDLLGAVFDLAGLGEPWDPKVERPIPEHVLSDWMRNRG